MFTIIVEVPQFWIRYDPGLEMRTVPEEHDSVTEPQVETRTKISKNGPKSAQQEIPRKHLFMYNP